MHAQKQDQPAHAVAFVLRTVEWHGRLAAGPLVAINLCVFVAVWGWPVHEPTQYKCFMLLLLQVTTLLTLQPCLLLM
jgi:hypothetical protein